MRVLPIEAVSLLLPCEMLIGITRFCNIVIMYYPQRERPKRERERERGRERERQRARERGNKKINAHGREEKRMTE